MAGINNCSGESIVIIDADLQDPPEVAEKMIEKWELGYEVVYGQRTIRYKENLFKKFTAFLFYRLLNFFSGITIPLDTGDFRLIEKRVIQELKKLPEILEECLRSEDKIQLVGVRSLHRLNRHLKTV